MPSVQIFSPRGETLEKKIRQQITRAEYEKQLTVLVSENLLPLHFDDFLLVHATPLWYASHKEDLLWRLDELRVRKELAVLQEEIPVEGRDPGKWTVNFALQKSCLVSATDAELLASLDAVTAYRFGQEPPPGMRHSMARRSVTLRDLFDRTRTLGGLVGAMPGVEDLVADLLNEFGVKEEPHEM